MRMFGYDHAREEAEKAGQAFGLGVTDACYYVGTKAELEKLPVVIVYDYANRQGLRPEVTGTTYPWEKAKKE